MTSLLKCFDLDVSREKKKRMDNYKLPLVILFILFVNCALKTTESKISSVPVQEQYLYKFYSTDLVLMDLICDSIKKTNIGMCISDYELDSLENFEQVKFIYIETQIRNSSSDYFSNTGKSLLTLTFGLFLTNSADVHLLVFIKDSNGTLLENTKLTTSGRTGYWGILPFYMGLVSTHLGTLLNSYRKPDHLQKYCLYEDPSKMRQVFETKKVEYCADYKLFLEDSYYKIEKDLLRLIQGNESI